MTRSVYLGQFTDQNAERVLEALDEAGIESTTKSSGSFTRLIFAADWGVRIFVRDDDLDRARAIAGGIAPDGLA